MADDNKYGYYRDIQVDENGSVKCIIVDETDTPVNPSNIYQYFKDIELTPEGYLKITIV